MPHLNLYAKRFKHCINAIHPTTLKKIFNYFDSVALAMCSDRSFWLKRMKMKKKTGELEFYICVKMYIVLISIVVV